MSSETLAKIDPYLQSRMRFELEKEWFPFIFETVSDDPFENNIAGLKILGPQMGNLIGAIGTREAIAALDNDPRIRYVEASRPAATMDSVPERISVTPQTV